MNDMNKMLEVLQEWTLEELKLLKGIISMRIKSLNDFMKAGE